MEDIKSMERELCEMLKKRPTGVPNFIKKIWDEDLGPFELKGYIEQGKIQVNMNPVKFLSADADNKYYGQVKTNEKGEEIPDGVGR